MSGAAEGPTVWRCPHDEQVVRLTAADAWPQVTGALDVAERTRLRNTLRCAACHTPYALPGRRTVRSVTVLGDSLPATRLTFDLPVLRCTEDAVDSLPPECLDDLRAVVETLLGPGS